MLRRHGLNNAALRHVYILSSLVRRTQWCIAKNEGGYTQTGVAKGLKVPCLFVIAEVSIRCQKNPGGWYTPYTRVYSPIHHWTYAASAWGPFTTEASDRQRTNPAPWILSPDTPTFDELCDTADHEQQQQQQQQRPFNGL